MWLCDVSAVTVSTPTVDLMNVWIGELKGKKPLNFHTICLVDLLIASNRVIFSSRSLKVAVRLSKAKRTARVYVSWSADGV